MLSTAFRRRLSASMRSSADSIAVSLPLLRQLLGVVLLTDALLVSGILHADDAPCVPLLSSLVDSILAAVDAGRRDQRPDVRTVSLS